MRLSILQIATNRFRNFSTPRKIIFIALIVLFILSVPALSWRASWFFKSKVCAMDGGTLTRAGMEGKPICVHPYPDGRKPCSSSEECIGGCVIYEPPVRGQPTPSVGVCRYGSPDYGCDAPIEDPDFFVCP